MDSTSTVPAAPAAAIADASRSLPPAFVAPSWLSTPDDAMSLMGRIPPNALDADGAACTQERVEEEVLARMTLGQRFWQYFHSSTGAQVRKNILVFYVADAIPGRGAGKLYWSERSRKSISQNRCLAMDHITDIYLGAQTTVLKKALEIAAGAAASGVQTGMQTANTDLLFSLLSEKTMLDLEATSMPELCYWLFGLGVIMRKHERVIDEKQEAGASEEGALNSSTRSAHAHEQSMQMTDVEMDSLKRELLADPAIHPGRRRHTRKFSVALGGSQGAMNDSFAAAVNDAARAGASTIFASSRLKLTSNSVVPVRSAFTELRETIVGEMEEMQSFMQQEMQQLVGMARQHTQSKQAIEDSLAAEQRKRRRLQNKLIELQGNIRVFARVRPLSAAEEREGGCIDFPGENLLALRNSVNDAAPKQFEFDRVYTPAVSQAEVFRDVAPFVQSAVDGFSVCVFAYGQTGAGKSYTMDGPRSNPGVNSRAVQEVFDLTRDDAPNRTAGYTYEVALLVCEIYNETIRDLLSTEKDEKKRPKLDVRQGADGLVYVPDLTEVKVTSVEQVQHLMQTRAQPNRSVACTNMNEHSSRSHSCVFLKVTGTNGVEVTRGRLVMIDLAGSERLARSGAEGAALKEAQAINTSLSALGNTIAALQAKSSHVPYRDSKLTWLLKDCLSGQSKCLMFVQLSPSLTSTQESSCSLAFAVRAKNTDLGVAKKNKGAAQVDVAGLKRSVATAKEESKAQLDRMQKQLRDQQSQMDQTHSALLAAQAQVKGMEREKEQLKAQLASTSSTSAAASTGVTALHESIRRLERENTTLKEKSNAAAALAAREAMAKDKELRELRARLASGAQHPKQAWSEESNEIRSRWVTAPVEGAAEDDTENAGMGSINLQPVKTSGKKRRSGEAGMADSPGEKKLILEDTTSTGASVRRAQTASRIAAPMIQVPILGINALQANSAALNGGAANSARTGAKRTLVQPPAAATARSTRARPATAAPIASPQQSPLKPLPSVAMEESDDNDNTPQAASTGAPLSITEAAMAKLQERRNKYKLEKAAAASKKQPATGGWKM